jgi:DNA helicase-2/ATP-dependent DNA helicase PcrA
LELVKLLFDSNAQILLVGDPRQAIYDTNDSAKHKKYRGGGIQNYFKEQCDSASYEIDTKTLTSSHRNNKPICDLSSKIYPDLPASHPCCCSECRSITTEHEGVFFVRTNNIHNYLERFPSIVQLRLRSDNKGIIEKYPAMNFGLSKGLSIDRVLIYPTVDMQKWMVNNRHALADTTRAQLYVAVTRARHSVGIVFDYNEALVIDGIEKYNPD